MSKHFLELPLNQDISGEIFHFFRLGYYRATVGLWKWLSKFRSFRHLSLGRYLEWISPYIAA